LGATFHGCFNLVGGPLRENSGVIPEKGEFSPRGCVPNRGGRVSIVFQVVKVTPLSGVFLGATNFHPQFVGAYISGGPTFSGDAPPFGEKGASS